jgi:hypothetical protein
MQRRLEENRGNAKYLGKQRKHFYPLSSAELLVCRECGAYFCGVYVLGRNGKQHRHYRHPRHKWGPDTRCPNPRHDWPAKELESKVWERVQTFFSDPEEAVNRLELEVSSPRLRQTLEMELRRFDEELEAVQSEKDKLTAAWARDRYSDEAYEQDMTRLEREQSRLTAGKESRIGQLAALKQVDRDRLLGLARKVAAGVDVFEDLVDLQMEPGGGKALVETLGTHNYVEPGDGPDTAVMVVDPDSEFGRLVWESRRKLLMDLGVKVSLQGYDLAVTVGVPMGQAVCDSSSNIRKWCSTNQTCSNPISSASRTWSIISRIRWCSASGGAGRGT